MGYIIIIVVILLIICSNNSGNSSRNSNSKPNYNSRNQNNNHNNINSNIKIKTPDEYEENNNTFTISVKENNRYKGLKEIKIPNFVNKIEDSEFRGCISLEKVKIPQSVTAIGNSAFSQCYNLKEVGMSNFITTIGSSSFSNCYNLKKIKIPHSVTYIGEDAFFNCKSLKEIEIPNSITTIERWTFDGCINLEKIKIPNSITIIKENAFNGCSNLKEIVLLDSITTIEEDAFKGCNNLCIYCNKWSYAEQYAKDNNINYKYFKEVKEIYDKFEKTAVYYGTSFSNGFEIQKIIVDDSVTSIKYLAFRGYNNLKEVEIPNSVTIIEGGAFRDCINLEKINIPNSITIIRESAFRDCIKLKEIELPNSVTTIGKGVFEKCNNLCIYCNEGSYAEQYARKYNIPFKYITDTNLQNQLKKEITNSREHETSKAIKIEKTNNNKNYKKEEEGNKIEFLSAQGKYIITDISNAAYEGIDKIDKDELSYSIRRNIFDKKLNRANGNKKLYANSLKLNILYYFNLIEDINKYITSCIKDNKFPTSGLEWESKFKQLQNSNKIHDINKAKNKDRLQAYNKYNSIDKLISNLEWDYTYFYINSSMLINCVGAISVNQNFVRPLLKESPSAVIKEFEKCCHLKTSIILKSIEKTLFENKQNLAVNNPKSFKEFYSSKTADQLKNDVDKVYYSKLKSLNLKDASFGTNGSKEFLGAVELALFDKKVKSYIDKGIKNVFTRDWGALDFSEYMDEIVEKYSKITMNEWNESYNYFEKNHSWLDKHPCASPEVAMKRFEFLQQRNSNSKENMVSDKDKIISKNKTNELKSNKEIIYNGKQSFEGNSFIEIVIVSDTISEIENNAFKECKNLKEIKIPNSVISIGNSAFKGCSSLEKIEIPNSVISIGNSAFKGCSSLEKIKIPDSVTFIGDSAFVYCDEICIYCNYGSYAEKYAKSFYFPFKYITDNNFENDTSVIYYGDSLIDKDRIKEIIIDNSVTMIGKSAFFGCTKLKKVEIPNSVTSIREFAFEGCSSLEEIEIPNSVTSIREFAFKGCSSLKEIEIPNSITSIRNSTFSFCSSLKKIKIPNSVTSIRNTAFSFCSSLEEIEIPDSVTSIEQHVFLSSKNVCICCNKGSYAEQYAKENNIPFKYITDTNSQDVKNTNNEKNSISKENKMFLKEIKWENSTTEIKELNNLNIMDNFPSTLGNSSYYLTYYICPDCEKSLLYKIKTRGVKTIFEGETKNLFNIFTCPICNRFYASIESSGNLVSTSTRLSDFALRSIAYNNDEYINLINYTENLQNK